MLHEPGEENGAKAEESELDNGAVVQEIALRKRTSLWGR
jgi:hypothetical protein